VDASHSMAYEEDGISKLHFAKVMMAALAYLARKQSDTFGLFTVNERSINVVQPRFEQQQFMRFLNELVKLKSEGTWRKGNDLEVVFDHHGKELIIFFTDLYDDQEDLFRFISRLKTPRNEVIVFHIMGRHERDFDYNGSFTFEDLESHVKVKAETSLQQKKYQQKVMEWIKQSRMWMLEKHITYQVVVMNDPLDETLRNFLKARKSLIR